MQSFRTELENPVVEKDIIELEKKIRLFHEGNIDEEKFRSLRLARGVYGQRQPGVQMVRIKLPFGRVTPRQLVRIADISEEYGSGNLHATTRQDIQIHYVSLDRTPELWAKLEEDDITLREACGNTVRNVTASPLAGVDPNEPFDVSPYAYETFRYFLRNPVCQEMGRKFKISFSSSDSDTAMSFMHDLGFIPKIKVVDGVEQRGFKVMIAGGLGAVGMLAHTAYEFLEEDKIIPFTEAVLRVFDRHGERARRMKARMKFLVKDIGLDGLMSLIKAEWKALKVKSYSIDRHVVGNAYAAPAIELPANITPVNQEQYNKWLKANVLEQKQGGVYAVNVKLLLGDMSAALARQFAAVAARFSADDIRISANQGYVLRFVPEQALPALYNALHELGLAEAGFDSTVDITACPGTDSCNLGISSSTGIARKLEAVMKNEYPDLIYNQDLKIKISGCPNSCGQHGLAGIGYQGSSIKHEGAVLPALQVVLGGGNAGNGQGFLSEKVIKLPSKRGPESLRVLLDDYFLNGNEGEYYHDYYRRQGKMYFYSLLKPLAQLNTIVPSDYIDWGNDEKFALHTGVGECAGVVIDLVATLLLESEEKLALAQETYQSGAYADAIYHSYAAFINSAKALLVGEGVSNNSQASILKKFQEHFVAQGHFTFETDFETWVLRINQQEPSLTFATTYFNDSKDFLKEIYAFRNSQS